MLSPGQEEQLVDDGRLIFGNFIKGSLHAFGFLDIDGDGIQDDEDPAFPDDPGKTFDLKDSDGQVIGTATTVNGMVWFEGLTPGDYSLVESPVTAGYELTTLPNERTYTILSGEELVYADGAAMLPVNDPRHEVFVGDDLKWGNTPSIEIYCPDDVTIECVADIPPPNPDDVTVTGGCDPVNVIHTGDVSNGGSGCEGDALILTRTYVAIDGCQNTVTCTQLIIIADKTPPVLVNCPEDVTVECDSDIPPFANVTATDNCGNATVVPSGSSIQLPCGQKITRTWTATDDCGKSTSCTQMIRVKDTTPPTISMCPEDVTVECDGTVPLPGGVTATDNCPGIIDIVPTETNVPFDCGYTIYRKYTATDICENSTFCIQKIKVIVDITPPTLIGCPEDVTIECSDDIPEPTDVTATDACHGVTMDPRSITTQLECGSLIERTWVATDDCNNSTSCMQRVRVKDTTAPDIVCPDNQMIECDGQGNQDELNAWLAQFTATDNCDDDPTETLDVQIMAGADMGNPGGLTICYEDFSDLSDMMLNAATAGIANPVNFNGQNVLRLTDNLNQSGSAFLTDEVDLDNDASFSTFFTFQITDPQGCIDDDGMGADGIVFVVQTVSNTAGGFGQGIGYAGIPNSVGIEFDTWNNGNQDANNGNHIGINLNGDVNSVVRLNIPTRMNNGNIWSAWVDYNGATDELEVRLREGGAVARPANADLSLITDLASVLGQTDAFVGFTSGTGCAGGDHDIRSWALNNSFNPISGCGSVVKATYTVTDDCGNEASCMRTFTIVDTTPPEVECPNNTTYECIEEVPEGSIDELFSDDVCDDDLSISVSDMMDGEPCDVTITRTWTAEDDCNNKASCAQIIRVKDTIKPGIVCPADATVECAENLDLGTSVFGFASATDNCDDDVSVIPSGDIEPGDCPANYTMIRTWTATDNCENVATCVQRIKVEDTTPPEITCPANVEIECDELDELQSTGAATATDICSDVSIESQDERIDGDCDLSYTLQRTWTATDVCGNATECVQTIVVDDTQKPICVLDEVTIECGESTDPAEVGPPAATDNCDEILTYTFFGDGSQPVICPEKLRINRLWQVTDDCGNTSTCEQIISVIDTKPPVLECAADVTIECDEETSPAETGESSATDACEGEDVDFEDVVEALECGFIITRTWTATDVCENSTSCVQIIRGKDTMAPELSHVDDLTVECDQVPEPDMPTADDDCDLTVEISITETRADGDCANSYVLTRTWTGTDDCGNMDIEVQRIKVQDTTDPDIVCTGEDVTIECDATPQWGSAIATDNCDNDVAISMVDVTVSDNGCTQVLKRTWTADDGCENTDECSQTITRKDRTAPTIVCTGTDVTIECDQTPEFGDASAEDNCQDPTVSSSDVTVFDDDCTQVITRTWTADDGCGNTNTCSVTVTRKDKTAPTITCTGADVTIECDETPDFGSASAEDNCQDPTVSSSDVTVSDDGCTQVLTRTWTADDGCGNTNTCSVTVTRKDRTAPVLEACPSDLTVECEGDVPAMATLQANDACSNATVLPISGIATLDCGFIISRTWTATDDCGNSTSCSQSIRVKDTMAPDVVCPPDATIECAENLDISTSVFGFASATDNCDDDVAVIPSGTIVPGDCPANYTMVRTWTATDECDNVATCVQRIKVEDTTPPEITCPANVEIECDMLDELQNTGTATATDICSDVSSIESLDERIDGDCALSYTILRTWTATDVCGNATDCVQTIVVDDTQKPICELEEITVECGESTDPEVVGHPSATDNCDEILTYTFIGDGSIPDVCPVKMRINRLWNVTDDCGNTSTCEQIISVIDTKPPVLECAADITIECDEETSPVENG